MIDEHPHIVGQIWLDLKSDSNKLEEMISRSGIPHDEFIRDIEKTIVALEADPKEATMMIQAYEKINENAQNDDQEEIFEYTSEEKEAMEQQELLLKGEEEIYYSPEEEEAMDKDESSLNDQEETYEYSPKEEEAMKEDEIVAINFKQARLSFILNGHSKKERERPVHGVKHMEEQTKKRNLDHDAAIAELDRHEETLRELLDHDAS